MAIQIQYAPNANLVGAAANQAGLGEFLREQQRLAEQQYQFDQELGLRQQQFTQGQSEFDQQLALRERALDAELEQDAFQRQMAGRQEYLQRYGLLQRAAEADANRQAQLEQDAMRFDYGLASDAMQQQGLAQRQGQEIGAQRGMQADEQMWRLMQADRMRVQAELPKLDPDERQDLLDQFNQKWQQFDVPAPLEPPAIPKWADPESLLKEMQSKYPGLPWMIDQETGRPDLPRGFNYQMTPEYWENQQKMEAIKNQSKAASDQQKADIAQQKQQYDAAEQQVEIENRQRMAAVEAKSAALSTRIKLQGDISSARAKLAADKANAQMAVQKAQAQANRDEVEIDISMPDFSASEQEINDMEAMLQSIAIPGDYVPPSQQMGAAYGAATGGALPVQSGGSTIIGPNRAGRYARKYPDGRVELLPQGFTPQ